MTETTGSVIMNCGYSTGNVERRVIRINGSVQGVGFRPFIYRLAARHGLCGSVQNRTGGVWVEVEGVGLSLDRFFQELILKQPLLAKIDDLAWERQPPRNEQTFRILQSEAESGFQVSISPDIATCDECLTELFHSEDRRFRYPFLNCTDCGPRFTLITSVPYDRERTTMASFPMCPECRAEYKDPGNRRFHAQPTACPACGPQIRLLTAQGYQIPARDPITLAVERVRNGKIGALKGLGGFHLFCDARNDIAVSELRRRKHRKEKPFAVMVADLSGAESLCEISVGEKALLGSPERPIVLLRRRSDNGLAETVAPGNPVLGLMLPYTPLHHLLLREMEGVPLVMTSGNASDEPTVYRDDEGVSKLGHTADFFLTHNRKIHLRCDDSVARITDGRPVLLRRSRGYAPEALSLPVMCAAPSLALGGQQKVTFALGHGRRAILSHHLGDLDEHEAYREYGQTISHYERLFAWEPGWLIHDLHPDYASTRYALDRAEEDGLKRLAVQHHHAHMASCMAENGLNQPVLGVTFDGAGYGIDGTIWGGEFLIGDYRNFERAAHLRSVPMPGGERAIREPWRMALSFLLEAGLRPEEVLGHIPSQTLKTVERAIFRRLNAPLTSSCGRLFDALASLLGVRDRANYEGQPAIELEWLASDARQEDGYPFDVEEAQPLVVDTRPFVRAVVEDIRRAVPKPDIALRAHVTFVEIILEVCVHLRERSGLRGVVLSGGVFANALLLRQVRERLMGDGFDVFSHTLVPPNDGGLCLGQLAIAAAQIS